MSYVVHIRIYREAFASWWTELWRPREQDDPPAPPKPLTAEPFGPEFVLEAQEESLTEHGAGRAADKLLAAWKDGDVHDRRETTRRIEIREDGDPRDPGKRSR